MKFLEWIKSWCTHRGTAISLYRRGMKKAGKKDYIGAVADYSEAVDAADIPIDVKGMVFYNRALAYSALKQDEKAADDLAAMLEIPGLPEDVKKAARRRRERIRKRDDRMDKQQE